MNKDPRAARAVFLAGLGHLAGTKISYGNTRNFCWMRMTEITPFWCWRTASRWREKSARKHCGSFCCGSAGNAT